MNPLAVLFFFLGVMAIVFSRAPVGEDTADAVRAAAIAQNYVQYRQAVLHHVFEQNQQAEGDISLDALSLPSGWNDQREWFARIGSGVCYIWGQASWDESKRISVLLGDTHATGRAQNGKLAPGRGQDILLPDFIAEGSVVSVFNLSNRTGR